MPEIRRYTKPRLSPDSIMILSGGSFLHPNTGKKIVVFPDEPGQLLKKLCTGASNPKEKGTTIISHLARLRPARP